MRPRPLHFAFAGVFVLGVTVGSILNRPSMGQAPAPAAVAMPPQVGRYQMSVGASKVLTDTATGQVWIHYSDDDKTWLALDLPGGLAK